MRSAGVEGAYLRSSGDEVVASKGTGQVKVLASTITSAVVAHSCLAQVLQSGPPLPINKTPLDAAYAPSTPGQGIAAVYNFRRHLTHRKPRRPHARTIA